MKKNLNSVVWGIAIIAAAVILLLKNVLKIDFPDINWWALFIIVPFAFSMVKSKFSFFTLAGLLTGLILMFAAQIKGFLKIESTWYIIAPVILLCVGLGIIFKKEPIVKKVEVTIDNDTETDLDEGESKDE